MEEIQIENRIYTDGDNYDVQTVELMMHGLGVHVQLLKNKHTGKLSTPSVKVFAHHTNDDKLPSDFVLTIFTEDKMTKQSKILNKDFQVVKIGVKGESQ